MVAGAGAAVGRGIPVAPGGIPGGPGARNQLG